MAYIHIPASITQRYTRLSLSFQETSFISASIHCLRLQLSDTGGTPCIHFVKLATVQDLDNCEASTKFRKQMHDPESEAFIKFCPQGTSLDQLSGLFKNRMGTCETEECEAHPRHFTCFTLVPGQLWPHLRPHGSNWLFLNAQDTSSTSYMWNCNLPMFKGFAVRVCNSTAR